MMPHDTSFSKYGSIQEAALAGTTAADSRQVLMTTAINAESSRVQTE